MSDYSSSSSNVGWMDVLKLSAATKAILVENEVTDVRVLKYLSDDELKAISVPLGARKMLLNSEVFLAPPPPSSSPTSSSSQQQQSALTQKGGADGSSCSAAITTDANGGGTAAAEADLMALYAKLCGEQKQQHSGGSTNAASSDAATKPKPVAVTVAPAPTEAAAKPAPAPAAVPPPPQPQQPQQPQQQQALLGMTLHEAVEAGDLALVKQYFEGPPSGTPTGTASAPAPTVATPQGLHYLNAEDTYAKQKRTLLYIACTKGHAAIVEYLCTYGHSTAALVSSASPSSCSVGGGDDGGGGDYLPPAPAVAFPLHLDYNKGDRYGTPPLYEAALNGHLAVVKLLLKYGFVGGPSHSSSGGGGGGGSSSADPLSGAKPLHPNALDVNRVTSYGRQTALMAAASKGHLLIVKCLCSVASVPFFVPPHLAAAAAIGHSSSCDDSAAAAANVKATIALMADQHAKAHRLMDAGAKDEFGDSALSLAESGNHDAVVEYLKAEVL